MKKLAFYFSFIAILSSCSNGDQAIEENYGIETSEAGETENAEEVVFDSLRAAKVGADPYGMRKYIMAFLRKGPNRESIDSAQAVELQKGHMANIRRLATEGKLALAGPFYGDGDLRGIYIFAIDNIEEARKLTESDPAVKAGSLEMELIPWYGSAALMEISEIQQKISKIKI